MSRLRSSMACAMLSFFAFVTGCGHTIDFVPTQGSPASPREARFVEVYTAGPPSRTYREVGYFEIEQQSTLSGGTRTMNEKLRKRAGEVGCDAIVIGPPTQQPKGAFVGTSFGQPGPVAGGTLTLREERAACLVYVDD